MGSNLIDNIPPELSEPYREEPPAVGYPPEFRVFAPIAPASAPPTSQALDGRAPPSVIPAPPEEAPPPQPRAREWPRGLWRYLLIPLILLLALAAGIGGGIIGARIAPPATTSTQTDATSMSGADLQQAVEDVSLGAQPSVVEVASRGVAGTVVGSGVVLTKDGYIVTNDHMVSGFSAFTVTLSNGTPFPARVIGEAAQADLAVLKIEASDLASITFADSGDVKVGQFVVALGSPVGFANTATFGVVSALDRTVSELVGDSARDLTGLIQTNVTLNPGNSGGALLDLQGRLIGIPTLGVTATSTGQDVDGVGFAIPSNQVKSVTTQLIQNGTASQ